MKPKCKTLFPAAVLAFAFFSLPLFAQKPARIEGFFIHVDQDFFAKKYNQDRNYTMGATIAVLGPATDSACFGIPFLRRKFERLLGLDTLFGQRFNTRSAFYLACGAFTPFDLAASAPVRNDRPYGSVLYFGSRYISVIESNPFAKPYSITSELNVGLLGTHIGKAVQSHIHEKYFPERPIPRGWSNQISDGGEPTAMYRLQFQQRTIETQWRLKYDPKNEESESYKKFQFVTQAEGMLGYYTNLSVGAFARFGFFSNPFWDLTGGLGSGSSQNPVNPNRRLPEFYLFGGLRARAVGYNALLQGQFRRSAHRFKASQIDHLVAEYEYGAVLRYRWIALLYQPIVGRTPEYLGDTRRQHLWGTVLLRVVWARDANGNRP
jgi:hypothetical protein